MAISLIPLILLVLCIGILTGMQLAQQYASRRDKITNALIFVLFILTAWLITSIKQG